MWKNAGVILLIGGLIFGWLRTHDHYVRADALAESRRDSLLYADKVIARQNVKLDSVVKTLGIKKDSIALLQVPLRLKAAELAKTQSLNEAQLVVIKERVRIKYHDFLVDSLLTEFDEYTVTLKSEIVVAQSLERLSERKAQYSDSMFIVERLKYNSIVALNEGLKKELGRGNHTGIGKIITQYILPAAAVTFIITKVTDGKSGQSGNKASTDRSSIRGTEEGISLR